jgi:hypothetical protein
VDDAMNVESEPMGKLDAAATDVVVNGPELRHEALLCVGWG